MHSGAVCLQCRESQLRTPEMAGGKGSEDLCEKRSLLSGECDLQRGTRKHRREWFTFVLREFWLPRRAAGSALSVTCTRA